MALRFIDSFEHYSTTQLQADLKWTSHSNDPTITASGRFGNGLSLVGYDSRSIRRTIDAQQTWVMGAAVNFSGPVNGNGYIFALLDAGTPQIFLALSGGNNLFVQRYGGATLGTGTKTIIPGIWYYIEWKVKIDNTTGTVEVRVDGVPDIGPLSSQDTQNTANATANQVQLGRSDGGFTVSLLADDFYACDGTGGSPTDDFLGDVRCEALFPSGNGNSSQWVNSAATSVNNYSYVDETTPDGDSTYVESSVVGDKDTYVFTNLSPTSGTVYGVQPVPYARKTDAGARSFCTVARLSGTETDSADDVLSVSYLYYPDVRETKPGGGAWTISDVNSAEFGNKVTV